MAIFAVSNLKSVFSREGGSIMKKISIVLAVILTLLTPLTAFAAEDIVLDEAIDEPIEDITEEPEVEDFEDFSLDAVPEVVSTIGDLTVTYYPFVEYTGAAIKVADLGLTITDANGRVYEPKSVSYKANKNVGEATFTIKTLKTTTKALQKALAKTPYTFEITKRLLTFGNTEISLTKKGAVKAVKYVREVKNSKGKVSYKKYTVPKKEWKISDGYIIIMPNSKNYDGVIQYYFN